MTGIPVDDEALAQMSDLDEYRKVYAQTDTHPCQVEGCHISQEEHHRLAYGFITENRALRQQVRELTGEAQR